MSFEELCANGNYIIVDVEQSHEKSFPKPLEKIIQEWH